VPKVFSRAPVDTSCVDSACRGGSRRAARLPALVLASFLMFVLFGCGTTSLPRILPSEGGNFVLHFNPADAQVVVVEEGFETNGVAARGAATTVGEVGVLRYDLKAGRYKVKVLKPGYLPAESVVEVPASDGGGDADVDGEPVVLSLEIVLEPDPNPPVPPTEPNDGNDDEDPIDHGGNVVSPRALDLLGSPNFSRDDLTDKQRLWYDRLWAAMRNPDQNPSADWMAGTDDAYQYARGLFTHNSSLLLGLRATGDLRFLDEVDQLMQDVRSELYDGWCGGVSNSVNKGDYDTMYGKDGYLNYRRRHGDGDIYCRDVADLEETLLHGHIAMVMYAYHVNRDLESPAGVDYGERADFWLDYLVNHFEAKWRDRSNASFPDMNFIELKFCHTYNVFNLYYYYVGKRLQDDGSPKAAAYLEYAELMTDRMFDTPYEPNEAGSGFVDTSTPMGDAVVYTFGAPGRQLNSDSVSLDACPITYARYMTPAIVQLALEGFYRWDDAMLSKVATGLAYFVMDTDPISDSDEPFAAGVTGNSTVEGIPRSTYRTRESAKDYAISSLANMMPWDDDGKIWDISMQVYEDVESDLNNPERVHLPASFLLTSSIELN
jgi:hypothetical protein